MGATHVRPVEHIRRRVSIARQPGRAYLASPRELCHRDLQATQRRAGHSERVPRAPHQRQHVLKGKENRQVTWAFRRRWASTAPGTADLLPRTKGRLTSSKVRRDCLLTRLAWHSQMPASTRPFAPTDPSLFDNRPMLSPNTARTFGMQYPTLDAYSSTAGQQASSSGPGPSGWAASAPANAGEYSGWRGSRERTLPPIADFYLHSAPSNPRRWGNEPATHHQLGPIQFAPWNTHHEDARRFGSQTESRDSGHAASQIQKRNIDPPGTGPRAPASDDRLPRPSTSSLEGSAAHIQEGQGEYAEAGSSASAEQPERSPKRARITGPRRNSHDSSSVTQRDKSNSFQGHRPNRSTSASPASSAGEDVPRINSADPHPMGMVAVTTRQPGRGPSGLRWWGEFADDRINLKVGLNSVAERLSGSTSFFACQVRLSQVIHTAKRRRRYPRRVSDGGSTSHQAAPRTKSLWIWGTNHILLASASHAGHRLDSD